MKEVIGVPTGSSKSAVAVFHAGGEALLKSRRYRMKVGQRMLLGLGLVSVLAAGASAAEMGTAFTYQGFLEDGGGPVTNTAPGCDFQFELWDALAAGAQVDGTQAVAGVSVDGDVWPPFGVISFTDIGKVVDAFKGIALVEGNPPDGAPRKTRAMLRDNSAPLDTAINFTDIGNVVNAFKTIAYPEDGPASCP